MNVCGELVVMLNDVKGIKKAFDNPNLSDRPPVTEFVKRLGRDKGKYHICNQKRNFSKVNLLHLYYSKKALHLQPGEKLFAHYGIFFIYRFQPLPVSMLLHTMFTGGRGGRGF